MEILKNKKALITLGLLALGGGFLYLRNKKAKEILLNDSTATNKAVENDSTSTNDAIKVAKTLKGSTWSSNSGATNAIACSQSAGQSLFSENDTMVAGDTVYTDINGLSVFDGKNTYWKKYSGGFPNQTMQINDKGVVSNVLNC